MSSTHPLDILFLTNFSDYCFRSIPAVSQMAASLKVRLTLLHAYDAERCSKSEAEAQLRGFFAEADRYAACQRITVAGDLLTAVQRHQREWPVNLIVAPASDTVGLPRFGAGSTRARLIRSSGVPVWTIGRKVQLDALWRAPKNVACWLDLHSTQTEHLAFAMEYARKTGAKLHLLRALPPVDEGLLHHGAINRPLMPQNSAEEMLRLCAKAPGTPEVHVGVGENRAALKRLLRQCSADVLFIDREDSRVAEWMGLGLGIGDAVPCPTIYVGPRPAVPVWNLETVGAAVAASNSNSNNGWHHSRATARAFDLAELGLN
jgi:nucleotide-binding universal stress UspA family protein